MFNPLVYVRHAPSLVFLSGASRPCPSPSSCVIEGPTPAATIFALTVIPFVWSNSLHTPCKGGVPVGGCTFGTSGSIVMMSPDRITVNRTSSLAHRYTPPGVLATSRPGPGLLARPMHAGRTPGVDGSDSSILIERSSNYVTLRYVTVSNPRLLVTARAELPLL